MRAGLMDRVITIKAPTVTVDANGTPQTTWSTFWHGYAQLIQRSTNEFLLKALGEDTEILAVFRIRWVDGVALNMTVVYNGVTSRIVDIKEIGRREALELRCIAITS
jgi:SPP1 family predicted phage head-tail adaptor